jgi:glutathione S-transferase
MLRLYVADPANVPTIQCSPPSWMCLLALAEKGAPHEVVRLDFTRGEHATPAMLAKNPRGTIPVLEHDGVVVHETLAILEYVDRFCPGPPLTPTGRAEAAVALTRLHESAALKDRGMALFAHLMRGGEPERGAALARELERELDRWEVYLARRVEPRPRPDLADLALFTYAVTAERLGLPLGGRPALARFCDQIRARPSAVQTWPEPWSAPAPGVWPRDPAAGEFRH